MLRTQVYSGTAYEIGAARGRMLKGLPVPKVTAAEVAFARLCAGVTKEVFPPALDTFRGMADASGLGGDDFMAYYFARREGVLRGCTMFAVVPPVTRDGGVIVGRNYDWVYSDLKWCEARGIRQAGAFLTLGYTHHWAGLPDALNEEGLFVAIASLPKRPPERPGLQWNLIVDAMMATCRAVREAEALLTSVSHLRAMSYLVADASGDAAVVEAGPGGTSVRRVSDGFVLATNHEVGGAEPSDRGARSRRRYVRAEEALRAHRGRVDEGVVKALLSDHEGQVCSGLHAHQTEAFHRGEGWGTIWSSICRPDLRTLLIAPGHPCEVAYERVDFRILDFGFRISE